MRASGMMHKAVAQSMLLYHSESWVATGLMLRVLGGFHHRSDRRITGMTVTRGAVGEWEYPPVMAALESAGPHPIMEYNRKRQATIAENVACRPIYELYLEAERMPGTSRRMRRWDQNVVREPEE